MTISIETAYAERTWSGVETSFDPAMQAQDATHVVVKYRDAEGAIATLTRGVHYLCNLGAGNFVELAPLALPSPPGTLLISRRTPSTVSVTFQDLEDFPAATHQALHEAAALRDAELWDYIGRFVGPFTVAAGIVDFGSYRLSGADPQADDEFATRGYVLEITGILALQAYVDQAAASATAAAGSATAAGTAKTGAETARDLAQLWASGAYHVVVSGGKYSAESYATDAENSATAAATSALALASPDYGFIADAPTETRDYGSIA